MYSATVKIGTKQWEVSVASTPAELLAGLSGVTSIPATTGMLFDLGADHDVVNVDTSKMLFDMGVLFIGSSLGVIGKASNVQPGESVSFESGLGLACRYFLEVNAGELEGIEAGDSVEIIGYTPTTTGGLPIQEMMQLMVVAGMAGIGMKVIGGGGHHSIHGPERERLVKELGTWAVGRAESVCPEDDVNCVEREAARLLKAYRK